MNPDQRSPGTDNAADRGKTPPPSPPSGTRQTMREIGDGIVVMWWRFFDWLAVVSWKKLLLVSLLGLILGGILKHPNPVFSLIVASFIIKAVAGGKRRAELTANEATQRAETEQLERTVLEARLEALQAQIEPHFLFNTLASIDQLIQTDPPRASKMQQSLIRYLRSAMPQMREGSRPSLWQTRVKTATKHGLDQKAEGGRIEIGAEIIEGQLAVHVLDTGIGFMPKAQSGVGLANVRERLKALYKDRAELIISVTPAGGPGGTIKVPYEIAPATPQA